MKISRLKEPQNVLNNNEKSLFLSNLKGCCYIQHIYISIKDVVRVILKDVFFTCESNMYNTINVLYDYVIGFEWRGIKRIFSNYTVHCSRFSFFQTFCKIKFSLLPYEPDIEV